MAKNLLSGRYKRGYTYNELAELWMRRGRKDHVNMNYCTKLEKDDEKFIFKVNGRTFAYIYPNNNITLINTDEVAQYTSNTQEAKALEGLTGMFIARHSKYASYERPLRIYNTWRDTHAVALFEGVTVNKCRVINANAYVDRKPALDKEKQLVWQRKLRPLFKLLRVTAKLDMLLTQQEIPKFHEVNLDDPTIIDATFLYHVYGGGHGWRYDTLSPERKTERRRQIANTAVRKYTEKVYADNSVYGWMPVDGPNFRRAA